MNLRSTGKSRGPETPRDPARGGKNGSLFLLLLSPERGCICLFEIFRDRLRPLPRPRLDAADVALLLPRVCYDRLQRVGDIKLQRKGVNCRRATSSNRQPSPPPSPPRRRHRQTLGKNSLSPNFFPSSLTHNENSLPPRHCRLCSPRGCDRHGAPRGAGRQVREREREVEIIFNFRAFFRQRTTAASKKPFSFSQPLPSPLSPFFSLSNTKNTPPPPP